MSKKPPEVYEIGYGKPPTYTRFEKGRSGNPDGRPQEQRLRDVVVGSVLDEPISVKKGNTKQRMPAFEVALRKLVDRALKQKDLRAIREFLETCEEYGVVKPAPKSKEAGVLIVPKDWDWDEWGEMYRLCGAPPWPGERSGLVEPKAGHREPGRQT